MNFILDEEQKQIRDSVRKFLHNHYPFHVRREHLESAAPSSAVIGQLERGGWMSVAIDERYGGAGAGMEEACLIAEEFGRALVAEPYWALSMAPSTLLEEASDSSSCALLEDIAAGRVIPSLAFSRSDNNPLPTAMTSGGAFSLSGAALRVYGAAAASHILVVVAMDDHSGGGLFSIPVRELPGGLRLLEQHDGSRVGLLEVDGVRLQKDWLVSTSESLRRSYDRAKSAALLGYCATAVGMMEAVLSYTTEYLKVRSQFGVKIGRFQSLQHRIADMKIALEEARGITHRALCFVGQPSSDFSVAVSEAKYLVGRNAFFVAAQGVQLHGAIGLTEEFIISHYFRALSVFNQSFGTSSEHLRSLAGAFPDLPDSRRRLL